jgi:hypothetical protein
MEDLLISGVGRRSNLDLGLIPRLAEARANVLDMSDDDIGALALKVSILAATYGAYMGGDSGVYDDVLFTGVAVNI